MSVSKQAIKRSLQRVKSWFSEQQRRPFAFQKQAWQHYLDGKDGLIHAQTGTGKTLAAFLGPAIEFMAENESSLSMDDQAEASSAAAKRQQRARRKASVLRVLWITPMRALATDTEENLKKALLALGVPWSVEKRTSDTKAGVRSRQRESLPEVLITTPESLSLMLTREDSRARFGDLKAIIVDEWHELLSSKRGVQTELGLARVKRLNPQVKIWGLSATLGNLQDALRTLVGPDRYENSVLVKGDIGKTTKIEALIPPEIERFPWSGHIGLKLAPLVADIIKASVTSLVFTNTRSTAEVWYQTLLSVMPELAGQMAVHHGSVSQELRHWIEDRLRDGRLRCCICTSSLELGVDFPTVDRVIQIGSPKGNARLIQRAGRSGHRPGQPSRITFVPTHALELVEIAAVQKSVAEGHIESRPPLLRPLDVLAQHVVTIALGGGFVAEELLAEVRATVAYETLSDEEWQWVLEFAEHGGSSLKAYPDYHRIQLVDGKYRLTDRRLALLHRLSIGTIVSEASMAVKYMKGKQLGAVEESFISRMKPGDRFMFAGKLLELVKVYDNAAWVKRGHGSITTTPRWAGGRMPLSTELAQAVRDELEASVAGVFEGPSMKAIRPLLELQLAWSTLPCGEELLIERWSNRDGHYLFVYPFEGRLVHEGMAALWALRLSQIQPISFAMSMNDYGFLLLSPTRAPLEQALENGLLTPRHFTDDILSSLNATEMSKRQFREVARVAGLIMQGYPGQRKSNRHIQASSNLFYEVFWEYDRENLLLKQARREVLERQLEESRLGNAMVRLERSRLLIKELPRPTPLAFPLIADQMRDRLSSESFAQRIERMQKQLEQAAEVTKWDGKRSATTKAAKN